MDHRASVGPPENFDLIGAKQFCILINEGLREQHYLLDVGCGSIRGGKFFIPYLQAGHYFGIEPNADAVNTGIEKELNSEYVLIQKKASFWFDSSFSLFSMPNKPLVFDFILAQSIFSHTSREQTEKCVHQARLLMNKGSKFLGTWFIGPHNWDKPGWKPGSVVTRPQEYLERLASKNGMSFDRLGYKHPSGQTWYRMRVK